MTAPLLASLVGEGLVALGDPVGQWLDAKPNSDITVVELAAHTSGLPRLAPTQPRGGPNPYQRFTAQLADDGLRQVRRTARGQFADSNFSYQLLAPVLERAADQSYCDLLSDRCSIRSPCPIQGSGLLAPADA
jgi:CubicO group peptidase (beta-lactamase class C family)